MLGAHGHARTPDPLGDLPRRRLGALGQLVARQRREGLELEPVEADDGDVGADLLGQVGGGVGQPRLVRPRLGRCHDPLHGRRLPDWPFRIARALSEIFRPVSAR